jgi:DNA-binding transcriptional MerR regulator
MTSSEVGALLGLGTTTLRRIEGTVFGPAPRIGSRRIRVFSTDDVQRIREWCSSRSDELPNPDAKGAE